VRWAAFAAIAAGLAAAQDTRHVTEPVIPPVCTRLKARLPVTLSESDENKFDTVRIQQALAQCKSGQAVSLEAGGFLTGPLQLRAGVTLLVGAGAILYGSRNPRDYDVAPGRCGTVDDNGKGCKPLIGGDRVADAAVMGDGVIDGRGGATLTGMKVSWWDLAQEAKAKDTLHQNVPRILALSHCDRFTLYRITLKNSPNFHVSYSHGDGFTAWGVTIDAPQSSRNTDGIDPANATNVTITHCFIHTGDDQVAIKAGGAGASSHMTISHNHFYTGHGMSIGSETDAGVSAIRVTDLSIDGADNGLRIKSNSSRGGLVEDVVYEDVCIADTKNPIYMDSNYSFYGPARDKPPRFAGIILRDVKILNPGKITLDGFDETHRLEMTLDNVILGSTAATPVVAHHARITLGPGTVNFAPSGEDVVVTGKPGRANATGCADKFEPMPVRR
jgi:polygalacturonase